MTYSQVAQWVDEHFDISSYDNVQDLYRDVRAYFKKNESYFPNEAEEYIENIWKQTVSPRRSGIYESASLEQFFVPKPEIETIDLFSFSSFEAIGKPAEKIFALPKTDLLKPKGKGITGFFGNIGRSFKKFFGFGK